MFFFFFFDYVYKYCIHKWSLPMSSLCCRSFSAVQAWPPCPGIASAFPTGEMSVPFETHDLNHQWLYSWHPERGSRSLNSFRTHHRYTHIPKDMNTAALGTSTVQVKYVLSEFTICNVKLLLNVLFKCSLITFPLNSLYTGALGLSTVQLNKMCCP